MKSARKVPRRQIFILTPDEKKAAACVIGAFLLGLGTMQYRAKNPRPAPSPSEKEQQAAKRSAASQKRSAARASPAQAASPLRTPAEPDGSEAEEE